MVRWLSMGVSSALSAAQFSKGDSVAVACQDLRIVQSVGLQPQQAMIGETPRGRGRARVVFGTQSPFGVTCQQGEAEHARQTKRQLAPARFDALAFAGRGFLQPLGDARRAFA